MNRVPILVGWTCFLMIMSGQIANADERKSNELKLSTEKVIVFKDGYFLIIKRGVATANEKGEVYTDEVPEAAVLGSFWAIPADGPLTSMLAGWKTDEELEEKEMTCKDTLEVLMANQGKRAKIEMNDKAILEGTIKQVLVDKVQATVDENHWKLLGFPSARSAATSHLEAAVADGRLSRTIEQFHGAHFVLETDDADVLLMVSNVRSLSIKGMVTSTKKSAKSIRKTKRLTFTTKSPKKDVSLAIMYFRPGIRWIPTYRLSLSEQANQKMADIGLQAELVNEAEDLSEVPIDLVVGVPNFRFRDTISPLVLESTMRNALAEAVPTLMSQSLSNGLSNSSYSQRSGEFRRNAAQASGVEEGGLVSLPGELTASGAQDLFVYRLPKTTIAKGERSAVTIFQMQSPYRDVYTWEVQVNRSDIEAAPSGAGVASPLTLSKNEVWHQIEVVNTSNLPWTTGAVLLMQGNQPLAQELLTYTSPKNECRIPVTVAVELKGSFEEKEVRRDLNALIWDGHQYAKIGKEATVHLCNNKKSSVDVEVTLRLGGRVEQASDEGKIGLRAFRAEDWLNYQSSPAVNNSSTVQWKTKLKPGDILEPKVTYHFFTRH